jgi:CRP/FNR family transcriptional regulator
VKQLAKITQPIACRKGELIFAEYHPAQGLFILRSGEVRLFTVTAKGTMIPIGVARPGDLLGITALGEATEYGVRVQAADDCELEYIDRRAFRAFLEEHTEIYPRFIHKILDQFERQQARLRDLAEQPAINRLGHLLLHLCETLGEETAKGAQVKLHLPLSRLELADEVGVSPEWVSKLFHRLKEKRILRKKGKNILVNKTALEWELSEGAK